MDDILVNRVTNSKLKTINLEELYPQEEIVNFDIKDYLFQELILKEKDFRQAYDQKLDDIDLSEHKDGLVVIKGCSNKPVPASAYAKITALLKPYVKSLMYGEPCSTVPIYKRIR